MTEIASEADLVITKTDGVASVNAGGSTTYTITVTNSGPREVTGATIADTAPAGLTIGAWTCAVTNAGSGGTVTTACGAASGSGNINTTATMKNGAIITYTVPATIAGSATGTIANTATLAVPGGITDPTPANNTATDTDTVTLVADLAITKTDGVASVNAGGSTTYTITVTNSGPSEVTGATIADTAPAGLTIGAWTCAVTNAGSGGTVTTACGAVSGSGNINTTATMKNGAIITYTVPATIAGSATGTIANTATVAVPGGITDPTPANNTATDTDTVTAVSSFNACESNVCTPVPPDLTYATLYTKLAGTAFTLYGAALKPDGTLADSFSGNVTVDLLANTATGVGLDADNCPTSTTAVIAVGTASFTAGRATLAGISVSAAYRDVRVRFVCGAGVCGSALTKCSSDNFAVRPTGFTVTTTPATADATGTSTGGTPTIKAGEAFTLTATSLASYNGTPQIDAGKVVTHAGAVQTGTLAGSFGAAVAGVASGSTFTYNESGYFALNVGGVFDDSYTSVDQPGGCTDDFSNALVGGKYGCKIGNAATTDFFGRFIPDHFALTSPSLTHAITGGTPDFNYFGQDPITTTFTLTAQNSANGTTQNYSGSWARLALTTWGAAPASAGSPGYGFAASGWAPSQPAGANIAAGATAPSATNGNTWLNGSTTVTARHLISRPGTQAAPTTVSITALPVDGDGVTLAAAATLGTATLRYGRLRLGNTFGSELLALDMAAYLEYWNGSYWAINTADGTTAFLPATQLPASTNAFACFGSGTNCSTLDAFSTYTTASASAITLTTLATPSFPAGATAVGGRLTIRLSAPGSGKTGTVSLGVKAPAWLGTDPVGKATFGVYNSNAAKRFIYRRESY